MQTDLITKVYFNEHLTHSCVGMPQGLQALLSSYKYISPLNIVLASFICQLELVYYEGKYWVYPRMVYRLAIVIPPG